MVVPFFGFVLGSIFFSLLALIVLGVSGVAPARPVTITAFVLAALASTLIYAHLYARLFGDPTGQLKSRTNVVLFLIGIPIVASIAGAAAARLTTFYAKSGSRT
jgi:hypothetical protein